MFRIDDHVGIAIAGLTSDARVLRSASSLLRLCPLDGALSPSNFMRQQTMSSRMVFNRPLPVNRLVSVVAESAWAITRHPRSFF